MEIGKLKFSVLSKNFIALLGSNFAVQGLRFATIIILAQRLGNESFGIYNYIILLISFGFILVEFGLKNLAIRELSQGRGSQGLVKQIFRIRVLLTTLSCIGVVVVAKLAFPSGVFFIPTLIMTLSLVVDAFLVDFILISREKLVAQALGNVAQPLFLCIGSYFLIKSSQDFPLLAELFLMSHILWVAIFWFYAKPFKSLPHDNEFHSDIWKTALGGLPLLVAQFIGGIQMGMDLLLLGQFHFQNWLGDYSAALKILGVTVGVINSLNSAVQPRLARQSEDFTSPHLKSLVTNTTRLAWIFVVPTVIGCWLFGNELVHLFFGEKFKLAAGLLRPLSLALCFFCLGNSPLHALFVSKKTAVMVRIVLLNCLVSFTIVFVLLFLKHPEFVAWGMVAVQIFYVFSAWSVFDFKGLFSLEELRNLFLPTSLMGVAYFCTLSLSPLTKLIFAALSYLGGILLMRVWKRPWFRAILGDAW